MTNKPILETRYFIGSTNDFKIISNAIRKLHYLKVEWQLIPHVNTLIEKYIYSAIEDFLMIKKNSVSLASYWKNQHKSNTTT